MVKYTIMDMDNAAAVLTSLKHPGDRVRNRAIELALNLIEKEANNDKC